MEEYREAITMVPRLARLHMVGTMYPDCIVLGVSISPNPRPSYPAASTLTRDDTNDGEVAVPNSPKIIWKPPQ